MDRIKFKIKELKVDDLCSIVRLDKTNVNKLLSIRFFEPYGIRLQKRNKNLLFFFKDGFVALYHKECVYVAYTDEIESNLNKEVAVVLENRERNIMDIISGGVYIASALKRSRFKNIDLNVEIDFNKNVVITTDVLTSEMKDEIPFLSGEVLDIWKDFDYKMTFKFVLFILYASIYITGFSDLIMDLKYNKKEELFYDDLIDFWVEKLDFTTSLKMGSYIDKLKEIVGSAHFEEEYNEFLSKKNYIQ
ncbi:MAG: hypothetical protein QW350_04410 [Candidatus Aenigmatarchaeota archaeon]